MTTAVALSEPRSLVERTGARFGVEPSKLLSTLKSTAFRAGQSEVSNEQMMALLIVSEQHHLNPFTKEIYAYPDKRGGIVPVVGVDGWVRITQEHPQFDGWEFTWDKEEGAMTCVIWRKDRGHPTVITEYLAECKRNTDAWNSMPRRMMRHRALMQGARIAFGFSGIYDDDEADDILNPRKHRSTAPNRVRDALNVAAQAAAPAAPEPLPVVEVIEPAPEVVTVDRLTELMHELAHLDDDDADALVDHARHELEPHEYQQLVSAYRARHNPEEATANE